MEPVTGCLENVPETAVLNEEIRKLKSELRVVKREFRQRDRTILAMENNYVVKMNMFKALAIENEKRWRFLTHMMRSTVDFLILLDRDLNVAYCSDLFLQKIGGVYIDEIEGHNVIDVYRKFASGELLDRIEEGIEAAVANGAPHRLDVVADVEGNGESKAYRVIHMPILDDDGLHGLIIDWSDTTDIINAKNEAEEASRSKSRFLATMSHEIRTPMNAIIGIAQIQLQKGTLPDEYAVALEKIYNSGNSLLGIINDILDLSKIETGKLDLVEVEYDMPSLINDTVQLNIVRIGSKMIEFTLDIDETMPSRLIGDELRLKQILNNLLSNAIKYTEKGRVKLSVSHLQACEDVTLRFVVEDTGQGIKSEDQKRLFSEYSRFNAESNRATEGVGLGLNITKKLVKMMDGSIKAESEYGKGSKFTVEVKQKVVVCAAIGAETAENLRGFTFKNSGARMQQLSHESMPYGNVLVVDDVETNLYVAEGLLSPYDLKVEMVSSGYAAIEKARGGRTYDIIFMDNMMPLMDGIETTRRLRADGYEGTIVALTANALAGNDEMFAREGFDGFLSKPIDYWLLDAVLNEFVRDRHPEEAKKHKRKTAETAPPLPTSANTKPPGVFRRNEASFEIEGLDTAKGLAMSGGAEANFREVLELYCRDVGGRIEFLNIPCAERNLKDFITHAHALKSASASIGAAALSEIASTLEDAGKRGDMAFIREHIDGFRDGLADMTERIGAALVAGKDGEVGKKLTDAEIVSFLLKLKNALEMEDAWIVDELLTELSMAPLDDETSGALSCVSDMVLISEFAEAAGVIDSLLIISEED